MVRVLLVVGRDLRDGESVAIPCKGDGHEDVAACLLNENTGATESLDFRLRGNDTSTRSS